MRIVKNYDTQYVAYHNFLQFTFFIFLISLFSVFLFSLLSCFIAVLHFFSNQLPLGGGGGLFNGWTGVVLNFTAPPSP